MGLVGLSEITRDSRPQIDYFKLAFRIDHRHLAMTVDDVATSGGCGVVPISLAGAARLRKRCGAGNVGCERKPARRDLARPAAGSCLDGALVEDSLRPWGRRLSGNGSSGIPMRRDVHNPGRMPITALLPGGFRRKAKLRRPNATS